MLVASRDSNLARALLSVLGDGLGTGAVTAVEPGVGAGLIVGWLVAGVGRANNESVSEKRDRNFDSSWPRGGVGIWLGSDEELMASLYMKQGPMKNGPFGSSPSWAIERLPNGPKTRANRA